MNTNRPTICVDFDGVIHSYDDGWKDGSIYGTVMPGFQDWLKGIENIFRVVVHTSRSSRQVEAWLDERGIQLPVVNEKPPAWVTIDDRAIRFDGNWKADELSPDMLLKFLPWNVRNKHD